MPQLQQSDCRAGDAGVKFYDHPNFIGGAHRLLVWYARYRRKVTVELFCIIVVVAAAYWLGFP